MESNNTQPGFFARLKQHHLYGVVVVYVIVAGFLVQLLSRVLPAFGWGGAFPAAAEEQEATRLDPDNATAWSNLTVYDQDLGDWTQDIATTKH